MRAVFLDYATVDHDGDVSDATLREAVEELVFHPTSTRDQVLDRVAGAQVILTNKIRIDAEVMAAAPELELVCLAATGYNNVDLDAARERGVAVCNITDYCTAAVTQHVFALILALNQHLVGYQRVLREGAWRDSPQFCLLDYPIRELAGATLGIIGYGTLGKGVARAAEAFGMRVLVAQRPGGDGGDDDGNWRVDMDTLLRECDVISLHCPLTDATRHLIDADALAAMKSDAILINTARGAVVDEAALADALIEGRIGGAGIDVLSQEPPVDGNPLLDVDLPNLIVTPHIAWATREARQRALDDMARNIAAYRKGERLNRVV